MAWFLRAVELGDACWACRRGLEEVDRHGELDEALEHLRHMASTLTGPVEFFVHNFAGSVERVDLR